VCALPALSALLGPPCAARPLVGSARVHSFLSKETECGAAVGKRGGEGKSSKESERERKRDRGRGGGGRDGGGRDSERK
jgi:hypothetical protein